MSVNIVCDGDTLKQVDIVVSFDLTWADWIFGGNRITMTYKPGDDKDKNNINYLSEIEKELGNANTVLQFKDYCTTRRSGALGFVNIKRPGLVNLLAKLDAEDPNFDRCFDAKNNKNVVVGDGEKKIHNSPRKGINYRHSGPKGDGGRGGKSGTKSKN